MDEIDKSQLTDDQKKALAQVEESLKLSKIDDHKPKLSIIKIIFLLIMFILFFGTIGLMMQILAQR